MLVFVETEGCDMKKRCIGFLLAILMLAALLPASITHAATLSAALNIDISYAESQTVTAGTIRYVSQLTFSPNFHASYWGDYVDGAGHECYTADSSMALSTLGLNATPAMLGDYWNAQGHTGGTPFTTVAWDVGVFGATYLERSLSRAMESYRSGVGTYSPPILHLTSYSDRKSVV